MGHLNEPSSGDGARISGLDALCVVDAEKMRELIAAIDLGSNSFRLQVGHVINDQIHPLDGLKESVRLAAGLSPEKWLDLASQQRGVAALQRFNERLHDFKPDGVRAVATNTLRVAKNAPEFLIRAEAALGFPIEVIAGRDNI